MSTSTAGNPTDPGQAPAGNPSTAGQPTGQSAPQQQPPNPAASPANPTDPKPTTAAANQPPADWQQQIQKAQEDARKAQESARYFQANYDRSTQQLQALAGAQPKADPMAEDVQFFVKQGYNEADARAFVEYTNRKVQPLMQQNQQLHAALNGTSQVNHIMQSVASDAQYGRFMQDSEVYQGVQNILSQTALQGQRDLLSNPDYVKDIIRTVAFDKYALNSGAPNGTQAQPTMQPPQFNGFNGPTGQYRPAPAQPVKQANPLAEQYARQMSEYTGIPLQQNPQQ